MGVIISTPIAITLVLLYTRPKDVVIWCKWAASYACIELLQLRSKKRFDLYDTEVEHDPYKIGFLPPPEEVALESPLSEKKLLHMADEVFFYGMNSKSECLTVRLARGPDHESEGFVRLRLSDGRTYELMESNGSQRSCSDSRVFSCGDLQIQHLSPMRRWRIFFNGVLKDMNSEKMVHVKFSFLWRALSDEIDFTTDVNTGGLAIGLSKANWNQWLPPIRKFQQCFDCYAQAGAISGYATVEGLEENVDMYLFGEKIRFTEWSTFSYRRSIDTKYC